jgi:hypothetical protein
MTTTSNERYAKEMLFMDKSPARNIQKPLRDRRQQQHADAARQQHAGGPQRRSSIAAAQHSRSVPVCGINRFEFANV